MRQYNDALDALCFTEEEQNMLTKKLEQAAQSAQSRASGGTRGGWCALQRRWLYYAARPRLHSKTTG